MFAQGSSRFFLLWALLFVTTVAQAIASANAENQPAPPPPVQSSPRAVPDDNLAYPVRVEMRGVGGSGFFLNTDKAVYFVTAKHVLYIPDETDLHDNGLTLQSYSKDVSQLLSNVIGVDLGVATYFGTVEKHPTADVAVVKIGDVVRTPTGEMTMVPVRGVVLTQIAPDGIVGVSAATTTKRFDQVQISNDVFIFGYPNSIGLAQIPQVDQTRPLIRKGIVAGVNRALHTIILDCEVFPGNSGGLVLEVENLGFQRHFRVIGVVSQYVPFDNARLRIARNPTVLNSGYSVVTPIDYVLELIHEN